MIAGPVARMAASYIRAKPAIELAKSYHYSRKQLKEINRHIEVHKNELIGAWTKHFGS